MKVCIWVKKGIYSGKVENLQRIRDYCALLSVQNEGHQTEFPFDAPRLLL